MNPLEQLRDIHMPEPVSAWPPAYGWWLLFGLSLVVIALVCIWLRKRYVRKTAQRLALQRLKSIDETQDDWPSQLNQLIKRVCLSYFPATQVANLYGNDWIHFLTSQLPEKKRAAFKSQYIKLSESLYGADNSKLVFEEMRQQCQRWIKHATPPNKKQLSAQIENAEVNNNV